MAMDFNQMASQLMSSSNRGPAGRNSLGQASGDIIPKGYSVGQLQQFTPEQMDLLSQLIGYLGPNSQLAGLAQGDEGAFQAMEAPAWRQFQEAQGQLGSRFSGLGLGAQKGSGFQNAAGQLGSDFAMQLQANRQALMRQALQDLMGYSESLLNQRPYDRGLFEKQQKQSSPALGGWGSTLGSIGGGLGGFLMGGPAGAYTGASLGGKALSGL